MAPLLVSHPHSTLWPRFEKTFQMSVLLFLLRRERQEEVRWESQARIDKGLGEA
jgi:hypothetical protein